MLLGLNDWQQIKRGFAMQNNDSLVGIDRFRSEKRLFGNQHALLFTDAQAFAIAVLTVALSLLAVVSA